MLESLRKDMFEASKVKDTHKVDILKMAMASVKNQEVEVGKSLSDEEIIAVLRKESKKVSDSIEQFKIMGRDDLLGKEQYQLEILESYLPQLMSKDDVEEFVKEKISEFGTVTENDMGKVMGAVMNELKGKADGRLVKDVVQGILSK